jgi:uncharacterized protein YcbX
MSSGARVIGRIHELLRYPVKSMAGESIPACDVAPGLGLSGDRAWAVRDLAAGEIRGAKKIPSLLDCRARYLEEPEARASARVEIDLGEHGILCSDDPDASARIGQRLGREVRLCPRIPAHDLAHYRRAEPIQNMETGIRDGSALLPEEPLPALEGIPADLSIVTEYVSPPGTYFDFFDLHLLSERSLASLARRAPGSLIDRARFRPNLMVGLEAGPGPEDDWPEIRLVGRTLAIGDAELEVVMPMMRCVMTTHPQAAQAEHPALPKDPSIMRTLVRECGMSLGVGIQVRRPGRLQVGDEIRLSDAEST